MSMTDQELLDFRADMSDEDEPFAWSDDDIQRLNERANGDYTATKVLAVRQLLTSAAKFYNYTAGYTKQEQKDIFDHLKDLLDMLLKEKNQVSMAGVTIVPPFSNKAGPNE